MPEIVKQNGLLIATAVAMVALFCSMTVPAIERDRKLADLERQKFEELADLHRQAREAQLLLDALQQDDPALQERAVRMTFQHGLPLPTHPTRISDENVTPR